MGCLGGAGNKATYGYTHTRANGGKTMRTNPDEGCHIYADDYVPTYTYILTNTPEKNRAHHTWPARSTPPPTGSTTQVQPLPPAHVAFPRPPARAAAPPPTGPAPASACARARCSAGGTTSRSSGAGAASRSGPARRPPPSARARTRRPARSPRASPRSARRAAGRSPRGRVTCGKLAGRGGGEEGVDVPGGDYVGLDLLLVTRAHSGVFRELC